MNQKNYQKFQDVKEYFMEYAEPYEDGECVIREIIDPDKGQAGIEMSVMLFDVFLEGVPKFVELLPSIDHLRVTSSGDGECIHILALVDGVW